MTLVEWMEIDGRLSQRMRLAEDSPLVRVAAVFLAHSGDSWFWLLGLGVVWLVGPASLRGLVQGMAVGILITAVLVMAIKFTIRRQRPAGEWGQVYRKTDPHSFPSGHAARAVMLAVLVLGQGYIPAGLALMIWAPLVGLARIALGVHYLSDVLAGWTFGALMGMLLLVY